MTTRRLLHVTIPRNRTHSSPKSGSGRVRGPKRGRTSSPKIQGASCEDRRDERHQGQLVIESFVEGVAVTFLIDTRGNITIVKPAVCPRITLESRPPLTDPETSMSSVDGMFLL